MFRLINVSKKYDERYALRNITLSIKNGMNFITGASGSGKSSLLKILSGIDNQYTGEVYLFDKNMKEFDRKDKSCLYNNTIGFIWQDYNLLEDYTVLDNLLLPSQLKSISSLEQAKKLIYDLKLNHVQNKKVKYLSGGQKQRVAIARELMKNPKIILADEPTSALDKRTSKDIIALLREISNDRLVIVVTHDTTHIIDSDTVFELDKGELSSSKNCIENSFQHNFTIMKTVLPFKNIFNITKTSIFTHKGRFVISVLSFLLGVCFLLTTGTDSIQNTSQSAFDEVFDMYGKQVLDIGLYNSFMGASGTDGTSEESPDVDVNQDIRGLYETYRKDSRVEFLAYLQPFDHISIEWNDTTYTVQNSGSTPVINKLIAGRMATGSEHEVVIPESFVNKLGITPEDALGKQMKFSGNITEVTDNQPISKKTEVQVTIVGVMDTTMITNYAGQKYEYIIEDSFLFSKPALSTLLEQANLDIEHLNILMRAKTPSDMISIKDELNKQGIVPIGNFEVIEDIVCLNSQSGEQTATAGIFIVVLVILMICTISTITNMLRKKEYAIFKVCGFSNEHLRKTNAMEILVQMFCSLIVIALSSPLINQISEQLFNTRIITMDHISMISFLFLFISLVSYFISQIVAETTNILNMFKTGEK